MKPYLDWASDLEVERLTRKCLLRRLLGARNKLTPIIDDIIMSAFDIMKSCDKKSLNEYVLTPEQFQNIIWATQILQECEFKSNDYYGLPNVEVIVNNVSVEQGGRLPLGDKSIVIDEATVMELLDLYQNMGVVIQRMVTEGTRVPEEEKEDVKTSKSQTKQDIASRSRSTSRTKTNSSRSQSNHSIASRSRSRSQSHQDITSRSKSTSRTRTDSSKHATTPTNSITEDQETDDTNLGIHSEEEPEKDLRPPEIRSTLSNIFHSSSGELSKKQYEGRISSHDGELTGDSSHKIFIKIKCFSDRDTDKTSDGSVISCAKDCPSHYHVRLDGDAVTLKMDQVNKEDGAVYCINTGCDEENEIRIVIKQCPECMSTIIGSSTMINDSLGESHESITLHGKQGDESKMAFSSDDDSLKENGRCRCLERGIVCTDIAKKYLCDKSSTCTCDELMKMISEHKVSSGDEGSRRTSEEQRTRSQPKIDVLIDTDNVDQSTVHYTDTPSSEEEDIRRTSFGKARSSVDQIHGTHESRKHVAYEDTDVQLARRRICSSMEFDVSTVHTRLRDHEIEHKNAQIVVELKKMGVDKLLRACRPAKCCRKAILNERQRTALPYCVSLKSLPLMGTDIDVIKQSIDMSVNKVKNATDLTQAHKDKLAFYVSLGRDDFKPNISFPWVIPVYDVKLGLPKINENKLFVLKKTVVVPKQVGSANKLMEFANKDKESQPSRSALKLVSRKKYFILMRPGSTKAISSGNVSNAVSESRARKKNCKSQQRRVRFKPQNKLYDPLNQSCYLKMLKCHQQRSIYKKKNIWSNISHQDWRLIFSQEHKELMDFKDFVEDRPKTSKKDCDEKSKNQSSFKFASKTMHNVGTRTSPTNRAPEGGDFKLSASKEIPDDSKQLNMEDVKEISSKISDNEFNKGKNLSSPKSLPTFWKHISEELFYTSNELTVFLRRTRSLEKNENMQIAKIEEKQWRYVSPRLESKKESTKLSNKLEYYVSLVDGDLIWSNSAPSEPQSYSTYYNHSNHTTPTRTPPGTPVEDTMHAVHVSSANTQRSRSHSPRREVEHRDNEQRRSTLSELDLSGHSQQRRELPVELASYPLGPESANQPWAPLLVSETSLPRVHEVMEKEETEVLEATLVKEPEPEPPKEPERPKSRCSTKAVCVRNKCVDCKVKRCASKKHRPGDVHISISKTKDKICVQGKAPVPCNKEICEIYKNKHWTGESSKGKETPREKKFKVSAKDNIEIYINNQKICLNKCGRREGKENEKKKKEKE